jgi:hypothetical protein
MHHLSIAALALGGSEREQAELDVARNITAEERAEYIALMTKLNARLKGQEVEATPVEEGEPTGEELPLNLEQGSQRRGYGPQPSVTR